MLEIYEHPTEGYEKVIEAVDPKVKLHCFIAVHDTSFGPALGGTRVYPYQQPCPCDDLQIGPG